MTPFDELLQDCVDGKYTNPQIKSLGAAFEAFDPWYSGHFMGKEGTHVNPEILVSASQSKQYQLLANLLVFLKKYYLPKQQALELYRLHGSKTKVEKGQKLQFKSLGTLSSWTLKSNPRVDMRVSIDDRWDFVVKAKMPAENVMWTPINVGMLALVDYERFERKSRSVDNLIAAMSTAMDSGLYFKQEKEVIVMANKPIVATVVKTVRS